MVYLKEKRKPQFCRASLLVFLFSIGLPLYANQPTYKDMAFKEFPSLKPPVNFNWSGVYLGGYLGGAWANGNLGTNAGSVTTSSYFSSSDDIASVNQSGSNTQEPSTPIIGIQFGDNFLVSRFIALGLVIDYSSFHLSKTNSANNIPYPAGSGTYSLQTSISTDWLYTMRGRLGYIPQTSWPLMLYATGGLAVSNLKISNSLNDTSSLSGIGGTNNNNNQVGWTLGAGFELPVAQHLTINAEYLYLHLGTLNTNGSIQNSAEGFGIPVNSLTNSFGTSVNLHANVFKVGLNYKF